MTSNGATEPLTLPAQPDGHLRGGRDGRPLRYGHDSRGRRLRRVLLRWQPRSPAGPGPIPRPRPSTPTRVPTLAIRVPPPRSDGAFPQAMPPRGGPGVGPVGRKTAADWPRRGSGASARQGALRAIDSFRPSRSWRTYGPRRLRRQSARPACHPGWCGMVQHEDRSRRRTMASLSCQELHAACF